MYKCEECDRIIETSIKLVRDFDGSVICPHCHGDVIEVEECDCGNYMEVGEKICEKCKIETAKKFAEFLDTFTENERDYLNEIYDGEWL